MSPPEASRPLIEPRSRNNAHTQLSSSPVNRSKADQPADGPRGIATTGRSDAHAPEHSNSASRDPASQQDGGGGGVVPVVSSGFSTRPRKDFNITNRNAGNQPETDVRQIAPSSSNNTPTKRNPSPTGGNWEGQPEDGPLGVATSGRSDTHTQEDSNSASRDPESQRDSDGVQMAASSGPSTRARENLRGIDGNAGSQPEVDGPQTTPDHSNSTHTQGSSSPANRDGQGRPGHPNPGVGASSHSDARTQGSTDSVNRNTESRQGGGRGGMTVGRNPSTLSGNTSLNNTVAASQPEANESRMGRSSNSNNTDAQRRLIPTNRNEESQSEGDRLGMAPGGHRDVGNQDIPNLVGMEVGAGSSAYLQRITSSTDKIARGQPESGIPRIEVSSPDNAPARQNSNLSRRNAKSRPEDDGLGSTGSSSGAIRTWENSDSAGGGAEGGSRRSNLKQGGRTESGSQDRPTSRGDPRSNPEGRQIPENAEAIGEIAWDYRNPIGTHSLNHRRGGALGEPEDTRVRDNPGNDNPRTPQRSRGKKTRRKARIPVEGRNKSPSHSETWSNTATIRYAVGEDSPDSHRRPTSEMANFSRNQTPNDVQGTVNHEAGYGGGKRGTRDTPVINTGTQRIQGDFDGNTGSHNNLVDKKSKIVNKGTLVNEGVINLISTERGKEPSTGRFSTPRPTICTSAVLTSRNAQPQQLERRDHMFPGWFPIAKTEGLKVAERFSGRSRLRLK